MPKTIKRETSTTNPNLQAQRKYVSYLERRGFDFSVVVADAFVRGIRDIGYRHTGTVLDELVDNSIQADAANVHIAFGYNPNSAKPARLAVIDDGHGMDPQMMRAAVIWGGTHREGDRKGFGRYGYGLPSASLSQGLRFDIFSRVDGGSWHRSGLDVDEIATTGANQQMGHYQVPPPEPTEVPGWVSAYLEEHFPEKKLTHGTIVVLDKLDRLTWRTTAALQRHLLQHFAITYRNYLRQTSVVVNGKPAQCADPLFLNPGCRYYDIDEDRAEGLPPLAIDVKDRNGNPAGTIGVRFSYMLPTFASVSKTSLRGRKNLRMPILMDHNGIIIMRNGRQIDVVTSNRCPWTVFINNDKYWGVEIDFPPTLDEDFSITTSKQHIIVASRIWEILREHGVYNAISNMRERGKQDRAELSAAEDERKDGKRASEKVLEQAEKFTRRRQPTAEEEAEREASVKQHVQRKAKQLGVPDDKIEEQVRAELEEHPYKVELESAAGAPFFRVEQRGGQCVLAINKTHRFFTDLYTGPESTPRLRAALEGLLFSLGTCELDSSGERQLFYESERSEWSNRLNAFLTMLDDFSNLEDEISADVAAQEASDSPPEAEEEEVEYTNEDRAVPA